jgi:hypothetical protein
MASALQCRAGHRVVKDRGSGGAGMTQNGGSHAQLRARKRQRVRSNGGGLRYNRRAVLPVAFQQTFRRRGGPARTSTREPAIEPSSYSIWREEHPL